MLQAPPNPPQAAQALRETEAAVRNLASVAAVIALALPESGVRDGHEEVRETPSTFHTHAQRNVSVVAMFVNNPDLSATAETQL